MTSHPNSKARATARAWRWVPVLAALFMTGISAVPSSSTASPAVAAAAQASNSAVLATGDLARKRCAACGRVMGIRHVEATATGDESFEFTLRMQGGTLRTSSSPTAGTWRVGDRIMLIGAAAL